MQRDMKSRQTTLLSAGTLLAILAGMPSSAVAQGIGEYGGVLGMPRPMPTGHAGALQNLYGAGSLKGIGAATAAAGNAPIVGDSRVIAKNVADKANAFFNEAQKREKAGKLADAEALYRSSVTWRERIWGTKDPAVFVIYGRIGALCVKQGKMAEAEAAYRRQIACAVRLYGAGAYEMCPILGALAETSVAQNKLPDAITSYRQIYQLQKRKMGDTNSLTLDAMWKLAKTLKANGASAEADALAKEGANLAAKTPENALLVQAFNEVINPPPASSVPAASETSPSGTASSAAAPASAAPGVAPSAAAPGSTATSNATPSSSVAPASAAPVSSADPLAKPVSK